MSEAPRDGSTFVVLFEDLSGTGAFRFDAKRSMWMEFEADYFDYGIMSEWQNGRETLEGYGWVPMPDAVYNKSVGNEDWLEGQRP
jgi:hypothetical protein